MIDLSNQPSVLDVASYLDCFPPGSELQLVVASMLNSSAHSIAQYNENYGIQDFPMLRILNSEVPNAEGIFGMIRVSHGMVIHCATVEIHAIDKIADVGNLMKIADNYDWIRNLMFSWVLLHEYMHGIRLHDASLAELGFDADTQMAIEYDADLCAIAGVYRVAQTFRTLGLSDMDVRKVVLASMFWCLRTLTTFCRRSSHSPVADRMIQMTTKLCTVVENQALELADNNIERPETLQRLTELFTALGTLEGAFQKSPLFRNEFGNVGLQVAESLEQGRWTSATKRWNQIRMQVAERIGGQFWEAEKINSLTLKD